MHKDNNTLADSDNSGFLIRHLFVLMVVALIILVLYLEARTLSTFGWIAVALLTVHALAVIVLMYGGRSFIRRFIQKMHGQPQTDAHSHTHDDDHTHHHHGDPLETEGVTLSWGWFYDVFVRVLFSGSHKKMMQSAVKLASIQPGEKALDVGCGTGTLAILAKQTTANAEIYAVDASPEMIEHARTKAQQAQVDVQFNTGLVEQMQFEDNTFDVVTNSLMMHHLPGEALQEKALAEMYRVLKPGGRLVIIDFEPPRKGLYKSFLTLIIGDMTSIDNSRVLPILERAGFAQVHMGPTDTPLAVHMSGIKPL